MNRKIRIAILAAGFNSQHDFADVVDMRPPVVSNIIHGRKKLTEKQAKIWQKILECKPALLKPITD